jgi:hypothetical protein
MKTASVVRGGCVLALLAALSTIALPVSAACNANPKAKIDPGSLTVPERTGGTATVVQLNGTGSTPQSGELLYSWTYLGSTPAGYAAVLSGAGSATPSFAAPDVGAAGATLGFRLTVTCGTRTDSITTNVNVTDVVTNNPPTAMATVSPATASEGTLVTLDGTGSFDSDPGTTLTYQWAQIGGTPAVTLNSANAAGSIVTFTAPNTPITTGATLTFRLTVSDGSLSGSIDRIVNVVWTNDPPVASLVCPGGVLVVDEGDPVTLDGSGTDSDGTIASYAWSQDEGLPYIGVGTLTTPSISFNAPQLGYHQLGGFILTLTVTDDTGAQDSAECGVYINDVTAPAIDLPDDITAEADSGDGAVVTYVVLAQDAVDDETPYPLACVPASGSLFALAALPGNALTTPVVCNAVDSAGNAAAPATFNITVRDSSPPVITVPGSFGVEATSPDGAIANYIAGKFDAVDGAGTADCSPASGNTFAIGTTPVTCNAVDARGNAALSRSFNLTVHDTTAPVISGAASQILEATSPAGAIASFALSASDIADPSVVVVCSANSGDTFPLGTTTVNCSATDDASNVANASFTIQVRDTTAPVISTPGNLVREATSAAGAVVTFTVTALDLVSGNVAVDCTPASGSTFPLGVATIVNCGATDGSANTGSGSFTVTVRDTTPPTIAPHADVNATASGNSSAVVSYAPPTASDLVDGPVPVSCTPVSGSTFNVGTTTVTCTAQDGRTPPNVAQDTTFKVIVSYTFNGFFQPIDNTATNAAKAGSAIPVKFSLGGNQGLNIFAANSPTSQAVACDSLAPVDEIETTVTAGGSTLQYDAGTGQYIYVWKTERNWLGCRQLRVTLRDGSTRTAMFKFR